MSKIIKNNTVSPISVSDVGVTIPASPGSYVIPPQDYALWAASSDAVTFIGAGDLIVNDGSTDLSISDGVDLVKGIFPKDGRIIGNTDQTKIGNIADKLKVIDEDTLAVLVSIASTLGAAPGSIFKHNELPVASKNETDLAGTTHTVSAGKQFSITSFAASYDAQAAMYVRVKKQTGGTGPWETLFRMTMMSGGQGDATSSMNFGGGIVIGQAGDVIKITVEASIAKGTVWAEYSGNES